MVGKQLGSQTKLFLAQASAHDSEGFEFVICLKVVNEDLYVKLMLALYFKLFTKTQLNIE